MANRINFKNLFIRKKQIAQFKCAQCGSFDNQYGKSIICKKCAVANKSYEVEKIMGTQLSGKTITVTYNEDLDKMEIEIKDSCSQRN